MNIGIKNTSNRNNAVQKHKAQDILHSIRLSKHFNIPSENENFSSNCIVIGSAGCGKTKGFVIPNLLEGEDSFVVLDLKHEILNLFQSPETKTYVLDLKTQNGGYNPFDYIENKEDAARFSECLYQLVVNREFVDGAEESFKETEKKIIGNESDTFEDLTLHGLRSGIIDVKNNSLGLDTIGPGLTVKEVTVDDKPVNKITLDIKEGSALMIDSAGKLNLS